MNIVKAIFISHEHTDHIKGVSTLANKYLLKVYITGATATNGPRLIKHLSENFTAHQPITIGSLCITAFPKYHDAEDPHSFIISCNNITVGVFTDIGKPCTNLTNYFSQCHAAFLEANYDDEMLENGRYPYVLKNRIRGGLGHLSNTQALEVFVNNRPPFMTHLLLSHLSKDNNSPELVKNLFTKNAADVNIIVASRYEATPVYQIENTIHINPAKVVAVSVTQMQLF